jgi:hypothetical protein
MVRCLCVLLAAAPLNGCGWFDGWFGGKASPLQTAPLRPGVDLQTTANGLPPAPNRGTYDAGVAPVDDSRSQPLGTIVPAKGGQKAQLDAAETDRAQRDAEREKERAKREAERNREKTEERPQGAPPASPPSDQAPAPASDQAPPPVPAPAPAPVPEPAPSSPPAQR